MKAIFSSEQKAILLLVVIFSVNCLFIVPISYVGCAKIYDFQAKSHTEDLYPGKCEAPCDLGKGNELERLLLNSTEEFHRMTERPLKWPNFSECEAQFLKSGITSTGRNAKFYMIPGLDKITAVQIEGFGRLYFSLEPDKSVKILAEWLPLGCTVEVSKGKFVFNSEMSLEIYI